MNFVKELHSNIVDKLKPLVKQIDEDWDGLLTEWSNDKIQRDLYWIDERSFRERIAKIINNPAKTQSIAPFITAILSGSGFCTIFKYPDQRESDANANFVRLLYLFCGEDEFIKSNIWNWDARHCEIPTSPTVR